LLRLELARTGADLKAAVSFHGTLDTPNPADAKRIKGSVLVLHGASDPLVPKEQLPAFEDEMNAAKVDWQLLSYGGAVHSFTDPNANVPGKMQYDRRTSERAFRAMHNLLVKCSAAECEGLLRSRETRSHRVTRPLWERVYPRRRPPSTRQFDPPVFPGTTGQSPPPSALALARSAPGHWHEIPVHPPRPIQRRAANQHQLAFFLGIQRHSSPSGSTTRLQASTLAVHDSSPSSTYRRAAHARRDCSVVADCMCTWAYRVGESTGTGDSRQKPLPAIMRICTPGCH
jgi:hypothetical protein